MDLFWSVVCEDADFGVIQDESFFNPPGKSIADQEESQEAVESSTQPNQEQDQYESSDAQGSPYAQSATQQIVIEKYVRDLRRQALQEYDDLLA